MASSHWGGYARRTAKIIQNEASKMVRMAGADEISHAARPLFTLNSQAEVEQFAIGSDQDIGGYTTVKLELDEQRRNDEGKPTGKFSGEMRLQVRPGLENKIRAGYTGFRNKRRPTLFGEQMEDLSNHSYLGLRVRGAGDPRTRDCYFVNLQTDGAISTDLWQHRLYFKRTDGDWENVYIPLQNFVLTNFGEMAESQIEMYREKVRSIGISMLGGNSGVAGEYELGIDSIWAANERDLDQEDSRS
ncbi:complex I intermediate-associated protein CIA30 [Pterulicium gracile]|uniref:Complex I intermediate-associated protein CIA30 n=1 Tax=Pterulicium gracile TaxID=1884261 RepID=A0A5C3QT51_9AGAR|nr:complex I intermediate-associated protein CIA30 [Pterula gracilis]